MIRLIIPSIRYEHGFEKFDSMEYLRPVIALYVGRQCWSSFCRQTMSADTPDTARQNNVKMTTDIVADNDGLCVATILHCTHAVASFLTTRIYKLRQYFVISKLTTFASDSLDLPYNRFTDRVASRPNLLFVYRSTVYTYDNA